MRRRLNRLRGVKPGIYGLLCGHEHMYELEGAGGGGASEGRSARLHTSPLSVRAARWLPELVKARHTIGAASDKPIHATPSGNSPSSLISTCITSHQSVIWWLCIYLNYNLDQSLFAQEMG